MVPSRSAALSKMYSTILVAVGRHQSVRSIGATSPHVCVEAYVLVPWSAWPRFSCVNHISCVSYVGRLACVGALNHVSRIGHANRLCMHQLFHASHAVGGLSEIAGGPRGPLLKRFIVITGPYEHLRHHSGSSWSTSVCEVHCGHLSVCMC